MKDQNFISSENLIAEVSASLAKSIQEQSDNLTSTQMLAEAYLLAISSPEVMADEKSRDYVKELRHMIEQSVLDSWGDRVGIDIDEKNFTIQVFHEDGRRIKFTTP